MLRRRRQAWGGDEWPVVHSSAGGGGSLGSGGRIRFPLAGSPKDDQIRWVGACSGPTTGLDTSERRGVVASRRSCDALTRGSGAKGRASGVDGCAKLRAAAWRSAARWRRGGAHTALCRVAAT